MTERLPDFLVVGAGKSGTTALYYYLKKHPSIFLSEIKEVWFLSFRNNPPNYDGPGSLGKTIIVNLDEYKKLFLKANASQLIGDFCPAYLYLYETTIRNIKDIYGEYYKQLKIIIILRNPIERAYSQYMHFKRDDHEPLSFEEAITPEVIQNRKRNNWNLFYDYFSVGMYYQQVSAYLQEFLNIKVIIYDDFIKFPKAVLTEIMDFLKIKRIGVDPKTKFRYNVTGIPKSRKLDYLIAKRNPIKSMFKPVMNRIISKDRRYRVKDLIRSKYLTKTPMKPQTRNYLISVYKEDIQKLQILLDRDLSHWISI